MNYGFHLHKNIQVCMQSCTAFCWPFSRIKVVLALFFFAVGLGALDAQGMHIRSKTCLACIAGNSTHQKNVDWLMPHRQICKNKSFSFKFSS